MGVPSESTFSCWRSSVIKAGSTVKCRLDKFQERGQWWQNSIPAEACRSCWAASSISIVQEILMSPICARVHLHCDAICSFYRSGHQNCCLTRSKSKRVSKSQNPLDEHSPQQDGPAWHPFRLVKRFPCFNRSSLPLGEPGSQPRRGRCAPIRNHCLSTSQAPNPVLDSHSPQQPRLTTQHCWSQYESPQSWTICHPSTSPRRGHGWILWTLRGPKLYPVPLNPKSQEVSLEGSFLSASRYTANASWCSGAWDCVSQTVSRRPTSSRQTLKSKEKEQPRARYLFRRAVFHIEWLKGAQLVAVLLCMLDVNPSRRHCFLFDSSE